MSRPITDSALWRDAYHDYRPDPEWTIESHLHRRITSSTDDSATPAFARQLEGVLDGYHASFCKTDVESADIISLPRWPDGVTNPEKLDRISDLPWIAAARVAMIYFNERNFDAKNLGEHKTVRPYVVQMFRKVPSWFQLKDYFLEQKESPSHSFMIGTLALLRGTEGEAAFKKRCRNTMGGLYAFRNHYVNGMIGCLRGATKTGGDQRGDTVNIISASVGSEDLTSDYDLTFSGPDDVPAAAEFNRAFRRAWGVEAGTLFDTNVYYRGWMLVDDREIKPMPSCAPPWRKNPESDPSLQAVELDFFGDIYGLIKIRRYCEPIQWMAFVAGIRKGIEQDRNKNADDPASGFPTPPVADIPRFKRLSLVDQVYSTQFLMPLLARLSDVESRYRDHLGDEHTPETRPGALLEHLIEFDKDAVIRAMNIAYIELGAKARTDEQKLKARFRGDYRWVQSGVDGKPVATNTGLSLHGLVTFLERNNELISESSLFANEPYFTQGAIWVVVGGQGGQVPRGVTVEHYVQSYNEQLGDSLKELQEYLRELKQENGATRGDWKNVTAAAQAYQEALKTAEVELSREGTEEGAKREKLASLTTKTDSELAAVSDVVLRPLAQALLDCRKKQLKYQSQRSQMTKTATGFYRASKYELRLREMLLGIHDKLKEDAAVRTRNQKCKLLFPDRNTPDNTDLMLLTQESVMAGFYDKYVKQLLDIRKARESYMDYSPSQAGLDPDELSELNDRILQLGNMVNALKDLTARVEDFVNKGRPPVDRDALKSAAQDTQRTLELVLGLFGDEALLASLDPAGVWGPKVQLLRKDLDTEVRTLEEPGPMPVISSTLTARPLLREMTQRCEALYRETLGMRKVQLQGAEKEHARKIMQQALKDPKFVAFRLDEKRKRAEVKYQTTEPEGDASVKPRWDEPWGLTDLIQHLLWHGALVNQLYRSIRSRGPVDLYVRHLGLR